MKKCGILYIFVAFRHFGEMGVAIDYVQVGHTHVSSPWYQRVVSVT